MTGEATTTGPREAPHRGEDGAGTDGPVADPGRRRLLGLAGAGVAGVLAGVATTAAAAELSGEDVTEHVRAERRQATWRGDQPLGVGRVWWSVPTEEPRYALTFDDGPDPLFTPRILDALRDAGARATFFMMGVMLERHRDLGRRVLDEGHEVGNHTWSHENLAFLDEAEIRTQMERGHAAIVDTLGVTPRWFRPPRGVLPGAALRISAELGYETASWSVSRTLADVGSPGRIADVVVGRLAPGAIVNLHDSIGRGNFMPPFSGLRDELSARREVEVEALPTVLAGAAAAQLESVPLSELVRGATPQG